MGKGALSTLNVAGNIFDRHILDHYRDGLDELEAEGFYPFLANASGPYISAVWHNFSSDQPTITEDILTGRLLKKSWDSLNQWFRC